MIEQASLVIGNGNWAIKSDNILGYKLIDGNYYSRDISVVRATTATRVNADGLVELVPYNLLQYSEQFNNAAWAQANSISVSGNTAIAPNGTLTADTLSALMTASVIRQVVESSSSSQYVFSVWIKKASGNPSVRLRIEDNVAPYNSTSIIVVPTDQWVRYQINRTTGSNVNSIYADIFPDFVNGTGSIYVWGAQLVEGSTAKDYLPTTDRLDIARIDYSTGSSALLVEPQRTNLLTYSSSFDNGAWLLYQSSITSNSTISPSGVQDADTIVATINSTAVVYRSALTGANTSTFSFYIKAGTSSSLQYGVADGGTDYDVFVNLSTGTITSITSGITATITELENGWYRCSLTRAMTGNGTIYVNNLATAAGQTMFIWGAQLEAGNYSTSYIPTTSASVTRNADSGTTNLSSSILNTSEGVLFLDYQPLNTLDSFPVDFQLQYNGDNLTNGVTIYQAGNVPSVTVRSGGSTIFAESLAATTTGTRNKIAIAYKQNDYAVYQNGVLIASQSSGVAPAALNQIRISDGLRHFSINAAAIWKTRLTNAQLAQLTTI